MKEHVVVDQGLAGWSARFAMRVGSAVDLSALDGEADLPVSDRLDRAHRDDVEYLCHLSTVVGAAFELRWLAEPGRPLSLTLLGRVDRPDGARIKADAVRALDRLAAVPDHVNAVPLAGRAAIEHAFDPFRPRGIAEVRKPCLSARPQRPDAPVRIFVAVPPLRAVPAAWPSVLELLAGADRPAMLSVGLVPTRVAPTFARYLNLLAEQYGALGRPFRSRAGGGRYAMPRWVDGDPFAATAERLYREAADRYQDTVFRLRITVATAGPFDPHLAQGVAERIGRGVAEDVPGRSCVVERPEEEADQAALAGSVRGLGVPRWGGDGVWRSDSVPQTLRELCELADPAEAAAAAWLPAAADGTLPGGFPVSAPVRNGERRARGAGTDGPVVTQDRRVSPPSVP